MCRAVVWQKLQVPRTFCSQACCSVSHISDGLFAGYKCHELLVVKCSHLAGCSNKPTAAFWLGRKSGIWRFWMVHQRKWSAFEQPLLFHSAEWVEGVCGVQCATQLSLRHRNEHFHGEQVDTELLGGHTAGIQDECYYMEILGIKSLEDCYIDRAILYSHFCPML